MVVIAIEDLRRRAQQKLPRTVFDYVDGGAGDEITVERNRSGFARYALRPRVLTDVSSRDQSTIILGEKLPIPLILAPTGLIGMVRPQAELMAARAAEKYQVPFVLSSMATCAIEDIARHTQGSLWFQMYLWKDHGLTKEFALRAKEAGYKAICLTLDVQVLATRDRDARNGFFTVPSRLTARTLCEAFSKPAWLLRMARGPFPTFANWVGVPGAGKTPQSLGHFATAQINPAMTWKDVEWFRSIWEGPLVLKGILTAEDARLALEHKSEAIVVSNHGGRQLDGATGAIEALPEIAEVAAGHTDIILDGGVRRGRDIVTAIALGATACMIGRPFVYGLAALGQRGAELAIEILREEVDQALGLLGVTKLADLNRSVLSRRGNAGQSVQPR